MRRFLDAGADPNAAGDGNVYSVLHEASSRGHEDVASELVDGGADIDKTNDLGETPLMVAAFKGYSGVVRRLLALGADHAVAGTGWNCEGKTALEMAEGSFHEETAAVLREWS